MSRSSVLRRAMRGLSLAGVLVIGGCAAERAAPETSIEPGAAPPAEEVDQAPLSGEDLAFDLIAMVDVRAPKPETPSDEIGMEPLAPSGNAADDSQILKYGAAVIVGRGNGDVYLATAEHVVYPESAEQAAVSSDQSPTKIEVRFWFLRDRGFRADVLRRDEKLDLAVLRVAETPELAEALERVDFQRVRRPDVLRPDDDKLRTIGNPQGVNPWYATPFELDLFDRLEGPELSFHTRLLMEGHSGGGLFTEDWYLVGVLQADEPPVGKALRIDRALAQVEDWGYPVALSMPPLPPKPSPHEPDCSHCPELVEVPPGEFTMGVDPQEHDQSGNETPRHTVSIGSPLLVGRYEVTHGQFANFVEATGYAPELGCEIWTSNDRSWQWDRDKDWRDPGYPVEDLRRPVVCVSWHDAVAYAEWLSRITGQRYRLLSEAEWEYAARAWTQTRYWWGDHLPPDRAACDGCGSAWDLGRAAPVGQFHENGFGLYDVHGNAWEWVQDCWHVGYRGAPTDGRAWEEAADGDCAKRMMRGGSSVSQPATLRAANRLRDNPDHRKSDVGFRIAREP